MKIVAWAARVVLYLYLYLWVVWRVVWGGIGTAGGGHFTCPKCRHVRPPAIWRRLLPTLLCWTRFITANYYFANTAVGWSGQGWQGGGRECQTRASLRVKLNPKLIHHRVNYQLSIYYTSLYYSTQTCSCYLADLH